MSLPDILTRYFDAANRFDIHDASDCFTSVAFVHDEERDHAGREAIRAWIEETTLKYHSQFEMMHFDAHGNEIQVTAKVSGDFPGSPINLQFNFILRDGKIDKLTIR